jgi:hypothetical protein
MADGPSLLMKVQLAVCLSLVLEELVVSKRVFASLATNE